MIQGLEKGEFKVLSLPSHCYDEKLVLADEMVVQK